MRCMVSRCPSVLLLVASLLPAACVTVQETEITDDVESAETTTADADLGRALRELDRRTITYYRLSSEPGEKAQEQRNVMRPAIEGQVSQHLDDLLRLAGDPAEGARRQIAVKSLAFTTDPRAVEVLSRSLAPSEDPRVLTSATYALSRIRSPTTPTEPLIALIRHPDADVRSNALMTLYHVFLARREAGVDPLDPVEHDNARALVELQLFDLSDPIVRGYAAAALGALGDARSVDPLLNLLGDGHPFVRTHVALALGKLGDLRAVDPLVGKIEDSPEGTPRSAVVTALAMLVESHGRTVPDGLGQNEDRWVRFLNEAFPDRAEPGVR
jgi:HEAT repeat protein